MSSPVSSTNLEALRQRWITERPIYEQLAGHVRDTINQQARHRGIYCVVESRAKEVSSFLKKVLRKDYESPYDAIGDKAGVRITVMYPDAVSDAERLVRDLFHIRKYED